MSSLPMYYLPPGVAKPSHIPGGMPATRCIPGTKGGPDGKDGTTLCGTWKPNQPGWKETKAGWWVNLIGVHPCSLRKTFVYDHEVVERTYPDGTIDQWLVPILLTIFGDGLPGYAILERRDYTWKPPVQLEDLCNRLRVAVTSDSLDDDSAFDIAAEILGIHYWISKHELELSGWMTPLLTWEIIRASAGFLSAKRAVEGLNGR